MRSDYVYIFIFSDYIFLIKNYFLKYVRDLISLAIRNNDINPEEPYDWEQQNEEEEEEENQNIKNIGKINKNTRNISNNEEDDWGNSGGGACAIDADSWESINDEEVFF